MSERCGLLACRQGCCTEKISRIHRVHTRPPFRWLLVLVVLSEGHDPRRAATWRFGSPGTCEVGNQGQFGPQFCGRDHRSREVCPTWDHGRVVNPPLDELLAEKVDPLGLRLSACVCRGCGTVKESSYLVDPASSHMLVSKIKPCMSKYKQICTVKLRMAH